MGRLILRSDLSIEIANMRTLSLQSLMTSRLILNLSNVAKLGTTNRSTEGDRTLDEKLLFASSPLLGNIGAPLRIDLNDILSEDSEGDTEYEMRYKGDDKGKGKGKALAIATEANEMDASDIEVVTSSV